MFDNITLTQVFEAGLFFIFTNLASEAIKYVGVKYFKYIDSKNKTFLDVE